MLGQITTQFNWFHFTQKPASECGEFELDSQCIVTVAKPWTIGSVLERELRTDSTSFSPCLLHDGKSITHHAIFFHTISFPISSHHLPRLPPTSYLPPFPGVWNGSTTRDVVFALCGRYFHSPTDTKELLYDPASVMNGDTLKFCIKEAWCKLSFFVLSFFYYLYWWACGGRCWTIIGLHVKTLR